MLFNFIGMTFFQNPKMIFKNLQVYITSLMTSNLEFVTGLNICISPVIYTLLNSYFMENQCISVNPSLLVSFLLPTAALSTDRLPSINQLSTTSLNLTDYSKDLQKNMCLFLVRACLVQYSGLHFSPPFILVTSLFNTAVFLCTWDCIIVCSREHIRRDIGSLEIKQTSTASAFHFFHCFFFRFNCCCMTSNGSWKSPCVFFLQ